MTYRPCRTYPLGRAFPSPDPPFPRWGVRMIVLSFDRSIARFGLVSFPNAKLATVRSPRGRIARVENYSNWRTASFTGIRLREKREFLFYSSNCPASSNQRGDCIIGRSGHKNLHSLQASSAIFATRSANIGHGTHSSEHLSHYNQRAPVSFNQGYQRHKIDEWHGYVDV